MAAAVLLPASLVVFNAERFLLAEADGIHAIGGDAERYEIFFHGGGATVAEAEVVFGRAALVGANVRFVEIKIGIVDSLLEGSRSGSRGAWRRRSVHGNRGAGGSGATGAASGDRVGGGIRRCDLRGTFGGHGTDSRINRELRGVGGVPRKGRGFALVDGRGVGLQRHGGTSVRRSRRRRRRRWCHFLAATGNKHGRAEQGEQSSAME